MKANCHALIGAILGCLLLVVSCDSRQTYIGTYLAPDVGGGPCEPTVVDLRENGEGTWTCNHEEVAFTWYVKDSEIRIHTREGGIMAGVLTENGFFLMMPNEMELRFEQISPDKN